LIPSPSRHSLVVSVVFLRSFLLVLVVAGGWCGVVETSIEEMSPGIIIVVVYSVGGNEIDRFP